MLFQELSNVNSLWRLEYDSPSSPMAVALFMAVVSLLSAKRVATQFSFGNPVISKHSLDLTLNIINILLGKVSWFADIVIPVQAFQMREIETLGRALAYDCNRGIFELTLFDSSCRNYNTLGSAPKRPFMYARWMDDSLFSPLKSTRENN